MYCTSESWRLSAFVAFFCHKVRHPLIKYGTIIIKNFKLQSYTEKTQRATELTNQISVDLCDSPWISV